MFWIGLLVGCILGANAGILILATLKSEKTARGTVLAAFVPTKNIRIAAD
jgi:hypothetical protein